MTRINTNVSSLVGRNNLAKSNAKLNQALTRLSTGLRINTGKDDPAGLIASENLRSDITSIKRALSNTERASQLIATADSALGEVSSLLNDIRGLVTEAANAGVLSADQLAANQLQVDSSLEALNRIAQTTTFQGRRLLDGSLDFITSAGSNFSNLSQVQIDQANLGATGSVTVDVTVATAATQASVDVTGITAAVTPVAASGTLTFATSATSATGGPLALSLGAQQATATFNFTTTGAAGLTITALAGGNAEGATGASNGGIDVVLTDSNATANGIDSATYNSGTNTITVVADLTSGSITEDAVAAAIAGINGGADFTATAVATTALVAGDAGTYSDISTGGRDASTENITFSATAGEAGNISVTIAEGAGIGATPTVTDDGNGAYTVTVDNSGSTAISAIVTALNTALSGDSTGVTAAYAGSASYIGSIDSPPGSATTLSGGADAGNDVITITADDTGTTANGVTVTIIEAASQGTTPSAAFNGANIEVTVDDTATTTISAIASAISGLAGYTASVTTSAGSGNYVGSSATPPTAATLANGVAASGGISADLVIELSGAQGAEVLSFGAGTSIDDIVAGIELVKDATGVTATANGTTLELSSTAYGSAAFVDIKVVSEGSGATPAGTFTTAVGQGSRATGTDVVATVNGVSATSAGNQLSINTATLDLSTTVQASFTGTATFTITGGGALFQLGPDVVTNQQARLGIGSVNTARLGGVSGKLFNLGSGGTAALATDPNTAALIVDEAINQVTGLRGRLGAFQRTTLETNRTSLGETLVNLTEAESSIRDADFAEETANLTRAQILVQSGTAVLQVANQNPQNVLALLG